MPAIENTPAKTSRIPLLIVAFTAIFRVLFLAIKPPHFDEGVNGWFIDQMAHTGFYHYDPANYHGPLHFYILFISQLLFGRSLWAIRLPIVMISTLTVYLVTCFDRFLDRRTCWIAAIAMAVSPGFEFYGRYAIHESEFVFFIILAVWGAAGIRQFGTVRYLWAAALGITGMILTKETYIIHFTAFALAVPSLLFLEWIFPSSDVALPVKKPYSVEQLATVGAVCASLILFFYSGNFLDFPGLHGMVSTFSEWVKTGNKGNGHEKTEYDYILATIPQIGTGKAILLAKHAVTINYYWFYLMKLYEWPVLLGVICSPLYIASKNNRFIRYLAIYGWGALAAYTIVPYKTPWCIITIAWPFFFVLADFIKDIPDIIRTRVTDPAVKVLMAVLLALFLLALPASLFLAVRLNFFRYTDDTEPYVYVQTFKDINEMTAPLFKLAASDPANYNMKGNILLTSYHPLPWILGDFTNLSWFDDDRSPDETDADFLLVDDSRTEDVEKLLKQDYFTTQYRLRSAMDSVKLYLNVKKFGGMYPGRKADFTPPKPAQPKTGDAQ